MRCALFRSDIHTSMRLIDWLFPWRVSYLFRIALRKMPLYTNSIPLFIRVLLLIMKGMTLVGFHLAPQDGSLREFCLWRMGDVHTTGRKHLESQKDRPLSTLDFERECVEKCVCIWSSPIQVTGESSFRIVAPKKLWIRIRPLCPKRFESVYDIRKIATITHLWEELGLDSGSFGNFASTRKYITPP